MGDDSAMVVGAVVFFAILLGPYLLAGFFHGGLVLVAGATATAAYNLAK